MQNINQENQGDIQDVIIAVLGSLNYVTRDLEEWWRTCSVVGWHWYRGHDLEETIGIARNERYSRHDRGRINQCTTGTISYSTLMDLLRGRSEHLWTCMEHSDDEPSSYDDDYVSTSLHLYKPVIAQSLLTDPDLCGCASVFLQHPLWVSSTDY